MIYVHFYLSNLDEPYIKTTSLMCRFQNVALVLSYNEAYAHNEHLYMWHFSIYSLSEVKYNPLIFPDFSKL